MGGDRGATPRPVASHRSWAEAEQVLPAGADHTSMYAFTGGR